MDDLISRQAAIDALTEYGNGRAVFISVGEAVIRIEQLPPIQPAEPKTGKWILDRSGAYCCSKCMEPCAGYVMMRPRDKFCKMCGSSMRAIDADALQLAIVEEGQANKRKKYIIGDIWELTGAEITEVINSQPTIQPDIVRCKDCKHWIPYDWMFSEIWQSKNIADYPEDEIGCDCCDMAMKANDFCSRAERREVTT